MGLVHSLFHGKEKKHKLTVAETLVESGASVDRTTNNVLSLLIGASVELSQCKLLYLSSQSRRRTEMITAAIINIVNYYIDKPDIVKQLRVADPKNPALEAYIYEAMRKAITTRE